MLKDVREMPVTCELFDIKFEERIEEIAGQDTQVTFDLYKEQGGALYLTRDGGEANVIIGPRYMEHFKQMGERGYLRNNALELWEKTYGILYK